MNAKDAYEHTYESEIAGVFRSIMHAASSGCIHCSCSIREKSISDRIMARLKELQYTVVVNSSGSLQISWGPK